MNLNNKIIWITGASAGIGAALAQELSKAGAKLVLSARRENKLAEIKSACMNSETHLLLPLDLTAPTSFPAAVERVMNTFGRVDILINNGGISHRGLVVDTILEVDHKIMEVNYFGTVALTKAVLPKMREQRSGQIVCISSVMGKLGTPLRSAYAASKHALHGFYDCLRPEVWRDGIKITLVCPGFIRTDISINSLKGDGSTYGEMDKTQDAGMAPEQFAKKMIPVLTKAPAEIYIGGKEIAGVYLKRFIPRLFNFIIRKVKVV